MAGNEQDREDLIAEATALVDRIELQMPQAPGGDQVIVFAGFRRNGFLSIYFSQDLHYQFDLDGCLRRAFADPYLYRASYGNLSRLERKRSGNQTILRRADLDAQQSREFMNRCQQQLNDLLKILLSNDLSVLRFVLSHAEATSADFLNRLKSSLQSILNKTEDFFSQTIKGKRLK